MSARDLWMWFGIPMLLAAVLTGFVAWVAKRLRVLDVPNARSSHSIPTPRGGGLAIVLIALGAMAAWGAVGGNPPVGLLWIGGSGVLVALVGLVDDGVGLPWWFRLIVQMAASALGIAALLVGGGVAAGAPHWIQVTAIGGLFIGGVWATNLFNFMDGIDGLAAAEAVFIGLSATTIVLVAGCPASTAAPVTVLAGAAAGFLVLNLPPARIFMGDVGSCFLGISLFYLLVLVSAEFEVSISVWVILWGGFLCDATVTLLRRVFSGKRWQDAHRTHAYQRLARKWRSHGKVVAAYMIVNVGWLFPLAVGAALRPAYGEAIACIALAPLVLVAWKCGAGRDE